MFNNKYWSANTQGMTLSSALSELKSGFLVALLALPLSLGIATASDFPNPLYGVLTAIIGGLFVTLLMGARLTIKGPAAGLIVIVSSCVQAFGGGQVGWQLTLGAIVVAGFLQMLFGFLKWGKLSDFFPLTVVHGMLAAIGLMIISKQLHVLMGVNPVENGKPLVEPLQLIGQIPHSFSTSMANIDTRSAFLLGALSLIIVFLYPLIPYRRIKLIPMPLVVLAFTIPMASFLGLSQENHQLIKIGQFYSILGWKVDFSGFQQYGTFIQYTLLFAVIGSLESLLTAKAMDILDPIQQRSNFNKDLVAVGSGNILSGMLGGLPMISEVARSSYNISVGAKTRWSNFFHGFSLLLMVIFFGNIIEMVPKTALAAMLIGVGYKLAHPKSFKQTLEIGKEQLLIYVITITIVLLTDLLVGVLAGIVVKLILQLLNRVSFSDMFRAKCVIVELKNSSIRFQVHGAAVFSNYLILKSQLEQLPIGRNLEIDLSHCQMVDHTVMENLHFFEREYKSTGGQVHLIGLENHKSLSNHAQSVKVKK